MNTNEIMVYIIGYTLAFIIAVFITRAIFSIPMFLKCQRMQILLLAEIAKANGVDDERIEKIKQDKIAL
jgi:hypothetical protein